MASFDALVIGAGPAGSALGLVLARAGLRVALVSKADSAVRRSVGETVPGLFPLVLAELGLRDDFLLQGHRVAHERRSVWGGWDLNERNALFEAYGSGFHLDRATFDRWLLDHARRAGAEWLVAARLGKPEQELGRFRIGQSGGLPLEAPWLIDATGANAWVARRLGGVRECAHRLVGVARWFRGCRLEPFTLVEASTHGWHYSAPLPDGTLVVTWITDASHQSARSGQSAASWEEHLSLASHTRARIGTGVALGNASTRVTGSALCTRTEAESRFLAIGDAAVGFDPVSGDGLTFAIRSALEAARVIQAPRAEHPDLLERYWRGVRRVFDQHIELRRQVYRLESRFVGSPFWDRAQA